MGRPGDGSAIDLARYPLSYPGPTPGRSVLVLPGCEHPLDPGPSGRPADAVVTRCEACRSGDGRSHVRLDDELRACAAAPMHLRTPVAAVGSNASPGVLRAKLHAVGIAAVVPTVCGVLHHLRISLSAHVSRPGFIPAAPARVSGDVMAVVVGWFDAEQLARLDATEPNYDRVRLAARDHRPELAGWPDLEVVEVYRSKWGVLTGTHGPLALRPQEELSARFAQLGIEPWASMSPAAAARMLAASAGLRERVRAEFGRLDLVRQQPNVLQRRPADDVN